METFDVIVVGAGLAGITAALAAREAEPGAHIALLAKHTLEEPAASATARLLAPYEPVAHLRDPYQLTSEAELEQRKARLAAYLEAHASGYLEPGWIAQLLATLPAVETLLDRLNVPFRTDEEGRRHTQRLAELEPVAEPPGDESGNHATTAEQEALGEAVLGLDAGLSSGEAVRNALIGELRRAQVVPFERTMLLEFIRRPDEAEQACIGVQLLDFDTGHTSTLLTRSVVLATGGLGTGFGEASLLGEEATGDGQAALLRAGGELIEADRFEWVVSLPDKACVLRGPLWTALPRLLIGTEESAADTEREILPGDEGPTDPARLTEVYLKKAVHAACATESATTKESNPIDVMLWQAFQTACTATNERGNGEAEQDSTTPWQADLDDPAGRYLDWLAPLSDEVLPTEALEQGAQPTTVPTLLTLDFGANPAWLPEDSSEEEVRTTPLERLRREAPELLGWLKEAGYDLESEPRLPVSLRLRRALGGCRVYAPSLATSVPHVYACGDAAGGLDTDSWPDGFALAVRLASGLVAGRAAAAHKTAGEAVPTEADLPRRIRRDATRLPTKRPHRRALTSALAELTGIAGTSTGRRSAASLDAADAQAVEAVAAALWTVLGHRRNEVEMLNTATLERCVLACRRHRNALDEGSADPQATALQVTLPPTSRRLPATEPRVLKRRVRIPSDC